MLVSSWLVALASWIEVVVHKIWVLLFVFLVVVIGVSNVSFANSIKQGEFSEHCDMIEVHHKHCGSEEVFQQVIFWRWNEAKQEYHVREWRMWMPDFIRPQENGGGYVFRFHDDCCSVFRSIHASHFRESWTMRDPERDNLKLLPENERLRFVKRKSQLATEQAQ
jgi:hypothetical protein